MFPRLLAATVGAALVLTGCAADPEPSVDSSTPDATDTSPSDGTTATDRPTASDSPSPDATGTSTPDPSNTDHTSGASTSPPATPGGEPSATSQPSNGTNVPTPVPAGTYTYDTTGESQLGLATPRKFPSTTTLRTTAADGQDRQRGVRDYRDSEGKGTVSTTTLQYGVEGVVLQSIETLTTVAGPFGSDITSGGLLTAKPPTVIAPVDVAVGFQAKFHLVGDDTTADGTLRVTARETLTVGGQSLDVLKVTVDVILSGDTEGEQHATWWIRPSDLLIVKEHATLEATSQGVDYREEQTSVLRSLQPA